jgi:hypothetical protein
VEDVQIGQKGMNGKRRKNKTIPRPESRPHGIVFQNPHGKEKRSKGVIKNIQHKKAEEDPQQLNALILLGRV